MPRRPAKQSRPRQPRRRQHNFNIGRLLPTRRQRQQWYRWVRTAPATLQLALVVTACAALWLALNWAYQVIRKPSELFFPVSGALYKTPTETWRRYEALFRKHSTAVVTPELLAALAQVEGSGNPVVRTYWRWSFNSQPFEVYRPASSAVGMYQMTDGTFAEARRLCIHDHVVVADGPWSAWHSCWFNSLYTRVIPSHAVELTATHLDRNIAMILARRLSVRAGAAQQQDLAAVIHLCGAGAGARYANRGFRLPAGQRCGDHDVRGYLDRVNAMKRLFAALSKTE